MLCSTWIPQTHRGELGAIATQRKPGLGSLLPVPEKQRQRSGEGRAHSTGARAAAGLPGHSARPSPVGGLSPSPSPFPVPVLSSFGPGRHRRDPRGISSTPPVEEEPLIFLLLLLLE